MDQLDSTRAYTFVLDGQQRLSTLYQIFADPLGEPGWSALLDQWYWRLRYRWALQIRAEEGDEDYFGFANLDFTGVATEPDTIRDRMKELRINKTGRYPWFHPSYPATHSSRLSQVSAAATAGLVPLWEVASPSAPPQQSLHRLVLQQLAEERRKQLEASVRDGQRPAGLMQALRRVQPFLSDTPSTDETTTALHTLAANWTEGMFQFISSHANYTIPYVELGTDQLDRAVVIFEAMNRGGTPLATFDLITAKAAKGDLTESLADKLTKLVTDESVELHELWGDNPGLNPGSWSIDPAGGIALDRGELSVVFKNAFLNVMSLQFRLTQGVDALTRDAIKQKAILSMAPDAVLHHWEQAGRAVLRAWAFLQFRCGIRRESDLRNQLLVLPLALCLASDDALKDKIRIDRLEYWYWSSVLTGRYTSRQNENAVSDAKSLLHWLDHGGPDPFETRAKAVLADAHYSDAATLLRQEEEAGVSTDVDRYLLQYSLSRCPRDLLPSEDSPTQQPRLTAWGGEDLEDHHLIPLAQAKTVNESSRDLRKATEGIGRLLDSPLNRAYVSRSANRRIGPLPINQYIHDVSEIAAADHMIVIPEPAYGDEFQTEVSAALQQRFNTLRTICISELAKLRGY